MTAQRPDGRSSGQRVSFTRQGADRIARVVRTVEAGDKKGAGLSFNPRLRPIPQAGDSDIFRVAAFTGSWSVDSTATIEFIDPVHSNATATAINYFCGIAGGEVGVAKNASNVWHLIAWKMETATAVFVTATATTAVLESVTVGATQSTADCSINVVTTNNTTELKIISSTATVTYLRLP